LSKNAGLTLTNRIFGKWMGLAAYFDRFFAMRQSEYFRRLKQLIGAKINTVCINDNALSAYDMEIFEAYGNVVDAYRMVIAHHLNGVQNLTTPEIRNIWDGIYALIMSRLMQDENDEGIDDFSINPILAEKREIVAQSIISAADCIDEILTEYKSGKNWGIMRQNGLSQLLVADEIISFAELENLINDMTEDLKLFASKPLYNAYLQTVETALGNLNNLEQRKAAAGYNNLLKEEIEILRQIIVVQGMALDKAIWKNETTPEEAAFLGEVLAILREVYQKEGQALNRINKAFMEAAARNRENMGRIVMDVEDFDDFASSLDEAEPCSNLPIVYENFKTSYIEKYTPLKEYLQNLFVDDKKAYESKLAAKAMYFAKKSIWQSSQMVHECTACFAAIIEHYEDSKEHFATTEENGIIKGVVETIFIKIDALKDASVAFDEETAALIEEFNASTVGDTQTDFIQNALKYAFDGLINLSRDEKRGAQAVKAIIDSFLTSESAGNTQKVWGDREAKLAKKVINFKRDGLFFELSTFEEIMHYSVSRLRESLDLHVLEFVVEIDKQYKNIEDILTKYDIEKIAPKPHEPFNAKEHEVLMAEKNDDFKKGEIIKTMNSGYRHNDVVIVRANVIAAR